MENEINQEIRNEEIEKGEAAAAAVEKPENGGVTAAAGGGTGGIAEAELTDEEKKLVRNYAVNDPEVRRAIISDYIGRLKSADHVPEVIRGDAGASPVFVPRAARDMREAAVLAEALLKRK